MPRLDPDVLHHPAVIEEFNKRAADAQLRVADKITAFAGSMPESSTARSGRAFGAT